jgi:NitT/TauT family transport system permease protein
VAGVIAGIALGRNKMLAHIFIMIFGLGLTSKVALSFVMVFLWCSPTRSRAP